MFRDEPAHRAAMFEKCVKCNGRVFWQKPEPQYEQALGYLGICSMCGGQWFTNDLLGLNQDRGGVVSGYRRKWEAA